MGLVRHMMGIAIVVMAVLAIFAGGWLVGRLSIGSVVDPASLSEAERQFADRMREGAWWLVHDHGRDSGPPRADRYDISSVEKVGADRWRFNANMQCCGINGAIPSCAPALGRRHADDHDDRHQPAGVERSRCACSSTATGTRGPGSMTRWAATCREASRSRPERIRRTCLRDGMSTSPRWCRSGSGSSARGCSLDVSRTQPSGQWPAHRS